MSKIKKIAKYELSDTLPNRGSVLYSLGGAI